MIKLSNGKELDVGFDEFFEAVLNGRCYVKPKGPFVVCVKIGDKEFVIDEYDDACDALNDKRNYCASARSYFELNDPEFLENHDRFQLDRYT